MRDSMGQPFDGVLGNSSELRLLEFLLPMHDVEFNISELADEVNVSRVTITRVVKKFIVKDILKTRRVAPVTYYSLNYASPIVQWFQDGNNVFIEMMLGDEILYDIHDAINQRQSMTAKNLPESVSGTPWLIKSPMQIADKGLSLHAAFEGTASGERQPSLWTDEACIQSGSQTSEKPNDQIIHQRLPSVV